MSKLSYLLLVVAIVPFVASTGHHKPKSCVEVKEYLTVTENGYFILYDDNGNTFETFCDFESEPPYIWTLIESLTLENSQKTLYRKSFSENVPLGECNTTFGLFRLPKTKMDSVLASYGSTHFRATCNFNPDVGIGLANRRDYLRYAACSNTYTLTNSNNYCTTVEYMNVRGQSCRKCKVPLYSYYTTIHMHIDLTTATSTHCGANKIPSTDHVTNEDVFGYYKNPNPLFSCASNQNSTTNWWIGGIYMG